MFSDFSAPSPTLLPPNSARQVAVDELAGPPTPTRPLGRKDLSRIFACHVQTVKRWEQRFHWFTSVRAKNGVRIQGYPPAEVVKVAARLFSRGKAFDQVEAEKVGYHELLIWVQAKARRNNASTTAKEPAFSRELLFLSALAKSSAALPEGSGLNPEDLEGFAIAARHQIREILGVPVARRRLLRAFSQAMLEAALILPAPASGAANPPPTTRELEPKLFPANSRLAATPRTTRPSTHESRVLPAFAALTINKPAAPERRQP